MYAIFSGAVSFEVSFAVYCFLRWHVQTNSQHLKISYIYFEVLHTHSKDFLLFVLLLSSVFCDKYLKKQATAKNITKDTIHKTSAIMFTATQPRLIWCFQSIAFAVMKKDHNVWRISGGARSSQDLDLTLDIAPRPTKATAQITSVWRRVYKQHILCWKCKLLYFQELWAACVLSINFDNAFCYILRLFFNIHAINYTARKMHQLQ